MSGEVFTEEQRNTIRWYFGAHGEQPKSGYASAGISAIENMVEAIVAARVASAAAENATLRAQLDEARALLRTMGCSQSQHHARRRPR